MRTSLRGHVEASGKRKIPPGGGRGAGRLGAGRGGAKDQLLQRLRGPGGVGRCAVQAAPPAGARGARAGGEHAAGAGKSAGPDG